MNMAEASPALLRLASCMSGLREYFREGFPEND